MIGPINKIEQFFISEQAEKTKLKKVNQKPSTMEWILNRLTEKSTWRGIITALTGLGVLTLGEELRTAIITAGVALFSLIEVIFKESQSADAG